MDERESLYYRIVEQMFRKQEKAYLQLATTFVRDQEVAKDIVQDSFMALWGSSSRLTGENWQNYMFTILKNKCLEYRRNQAIHNAALSKIAQYEQGTQDYFTRAIELATPVSAYEGEIWNELHKQLGRMSEQQRLVFTRRIFEGKTYKEIAQELGITTNRVDYLFRTAKALVRSSLSDYLVSLLLIVLSTQA